MNRLGLALVAGLAFEAAGCDDGVTPTVDPVEDVGTADAAAAFDGGAPDATAVDSGVDAAAPDAEIPDQGTPVCVIGEQISEACIVLPNQILGSNEAEYQVTERRNNGLQFEVASDRGTLTGLRTDAETKTTIIREEGVQECLVRSDGTVSVVLPGANFYTEDRLPCFPVAWETETGEVIDLADSDCDGEGAQIRTATFLAVNSLVDAMRGELANGTADECPQP